jgi:trehalose 6-phosphate phosphatase
MRSKLSGIDNLIAAQEFIDGLPKFPQSALLLDYDGTLAPFCLNRHEAFAYPEIAALLQAIILNGRTRVVIISGRISQEVIPLLGVHPIPEIWGCHGLERLRPGEVCEKPRISDEVQEVLAEADSWLTSQGLHERAEFKTGSIAFHWRGLNDAVAEEMRSEVLGAWYPIVQSAPMELLEFDGGIEMRMQGFDKGDAVRTILSEIGPDVPVAYLGDDLTDERAFLALGTRGLSVLVRPEWRETAAALWLRPPEGLQAFLAGWLEACCRGARPE